MTTSDLSAEVVDGNTNERKKDEKYRGSQNPDPVGPPVLSLGFLMKLKEEVLKGRKRHFTLIIVLK